MSDFTDDVLGFDPGGGGIWSAARSLDNAVDPFAWVYNGITGGNYLDDVWSSSPDAFIKACIFC